MIISRLLSFRVYRYGLSYTFHFFPQPVAWGLS